MLSPRLAPVGEAIIAIVLYFALRRLVRISRRTKTFVPNARSSNVSSVDLTPIMASMCSLLRTRTSKLKSSFAGNNSIPSGCRTLYKRRACAEHAAFNRAVFRFMSFVLLPIARRAVFAFLISFGLPLVKASRTAWRSSVLKLARSSDRITTSSPKAQTDSGAHCDNSEFCDSRSLIKRFQFSPTFRSEMYDVNTFITPRIERSTSRST